MTAGNYFLHAFSTRRVARGFIGLLIPLLCFTANAGELPMLLKKTVLLSPEIKGRLVNAGVPLAGQKITRYLDYDTPLYDHATTDSHGRFHFESVSIKSSLPNNPFDETRIFQALTVTIDHQELDLWGHTREIEDRKGIPIIDSKLANAEFDIAQDAAQYIFKDPEDGFRYAIAGYIKADGYIEKHLFKDMGF